MNATDKVDYVSALAASALDPDPANIRAFLDMAVAEQVGVHFATRDRTQLREALAAPSDEILAELAQAEQLASDAVAKARDALSRAQAKLDKAEAASVEAKTIHSGARSRRLAGDRGRANPNVAAALKTIEEAK